MEAEFFEDGGDDDDDETHERVLIGVFVSEQVAQRFERLSWKWRVFKTVARATKNTAVLQWRGLNNGGYEAEELNEASRRALARLTLVSTGDSNPAHLVAGYASIREEEPDLLLAAAQGLQTNTTFMKHVQKRYGNQAVQEILQTMGRTLASLEIHPSSQDTEG